MQATLVYEGLPTDRVERVTEVHFKKNRIAIKLVSLHPLSGRTKANLCAERLRDPNLKRPQQMGRLLLISGTQNLGNEPA